MLSNSVPQAKLNAYLASALTNLDPAARKHVEFLSETASATCTSLGYDLYQPRKKTDPVNNKEIADFDVYLLDRERVATADLVVLLCDYASFGAGQELEIAANACVPVVLVRQVGKTLSRMVTGNFARKFTVEYTDPDDFKVRLEATLKEIRPYLESLRKFKDKEQTNRLGRTLGDLREGSAMPIENLAQMIGISEPWIKLLEEGKEIISNPSLLLMKRIRAVLEAAPKIAEPQPVDLFDAAEPRKIRTAARPSATTEVPMASVPSPGPTLTLDPEIITTEWMIDNLEVKLPAGKKVLESIRKVVKDGARSGIFGSQKDATSFLKFLAGKLTTAAEWKSLDSARLAELMKGYSQITGREPHRV